MLNKLRKLFMWVLMALVCVALWVAPEGFDKTETNGAVITFLVIAMYYRARYNRLRDYMHVRIRQHARNMVYRGEV